MVVKVASGISGGHAFHENSASGLAWVRAGDERKLTMITLLLCVLAVFAAVGLWELHEIKVRIEQVRDVIPSHLAFRFDELERLFTELFTVEIAHEEKPALRLIYNEMWRRHSGK
jgi:hypothetical protein